LLASIQLFLARLLEKRLQHQKNTPKYVDIAIFEAVLHRFPAVVLISLDFNRYLSMLCEIVIQRLKWGKQIPYSAKFLPRIGGYIQSYHDGQEPNTRENGSNGRRGE
jgi:hypothetical protein